jgi:hypothetical protein
MKDVLRLKSVFSWRIYQLVKMSFTRSKKNKHTFDFSIEELRKLTNTQESFKQIGSFRQKVIDIAEREINEKTDLLIEINPIKDGRKYVGFKFIVHEKEQLKQIENQETQNEEQPPEIDPQDVFTLQLKLKVIDPECTLDQSLAILKVYGGKISPLLSGNIEAIITDQKAGKGRIKKPMGYLYKCGENKIKIEHNKAEPSKNKGKKKSTQIDPPDEARKQAYVDMMPEYASDLWDHIDLESE